MAAFSGLALSRTPSSSKHRRGRTRSSAAGPPDVVEATGVEGRRTPPPHDLLLRVAKGDRTLGRTPVWLMRQAGRYMSEFREFSERYPFRQRSEDPEMATELSLQCWRRFGLDAVIMFSDILTPLPAMNIEFDVIKGRGPVVMGDLARCLAQRLSGPQQIATVRDPEDYVETHGFVRGILQNLGKETAGRCSLIGFVGAPFTLAAYAVEGGSTKDCTSFKRWMYEETAVVDELLERMTESIANYAIFQIQSGAQIIQIFDSWAHHLTPEQWRRFAGPQAKRVAQRVREVCPDIPLIYFANGGSSYLRDQVEMLDGVVDVLGIDQRMRLAEAARVVEGSGLILQGNVDPFVLRFGTADDVRDAARRTIDEAGGPGRHILNLGHGVLQHTPEENVLRFVEEAQRYVA